MKIMARIVLLIVLTTALLFSFAVTAGAEMLFGVSAEGGALDFDADSTYFSDISETPSIIIVTGDLNLLLVHITAEYGTAELGSDAFYLAAVKAGWELGPGIFKAKLYGGYRAYGFTETLPHVFGGLVGSLGVESKLGKFKIYGDMEIPLVIWYTNGLVRETDASLSYLNLGASFAPLPLIDVFVNYRTLSAESGYMSFSAAGTTFGVRFSF
jgi:hypothetical protein